MKELSVEEKAKRYDEAIEKFDVILNLNTVKESGTIFADDVRKILPELKESEDERIRKKIIQLVNDAMATNAPYKKEMLAWLEKQGEHDNFRNKIQIGDKVARNEDGVLVNLSQLNRVAKKQCEQKLYVNNNAKEMFIKALERVEEQNNKGYKLTDCDKNSWWEDFKTYCGYIEIQKPAWNEEDELIVSKILCICNDFERSFECSPSSTKVIKEDVDKIDTWLNSLKDRYTWKPTEEQMDALESAVSSLQSTALESLYRNLKGYE